MSRPFIPSASRLPPHVSPPWRARQWHNYCVGPGTAWISNHGFLQFSPDDVTMTFAAVWSGAGSAQFIASSPLFTHNFNVGQGAVFPPGWQGVLSWVNFQARVSGPSPADLGPTLLGDWSIYVDGVIVPGYRENTYGAIRQAGGAGTSIMGCICPPVQAPIHLTGGNTLDIEVRMNLTGNGLTQAVAQVGGYMWPEIIVGDAGSVREAGVDLHADRPLG